MTASIIHRVYRLYRAGHTVEAIGYECRLSARQVQWAIDEACRRRRVLGIVAINRQKYGEIA